MKIYILDNPCKEAFIKAAELETKFPQGEWRYFNVNGDKCEGLFQTDSLDDFYITSFDLEPKFFNAFLGLFTPSIQKNLLIENFSDFTSFCLNLNEHIKNKVKIYDLSRRGLWIWSNQKNDQTVEVPKALLSYLE